MLAVGSLPAITVNDQDGKPVALAEAGSKGYLLVYFYPKASTPGCTKQGCSLRDGWTDLQKAGVQVLGVSTDDEVAQKKFKDEYSFPFRLLADVDKRAAIAYKAAASPADAWPRRITYLIGPDGRVEQAIETKDPAGQAAAVLDIVKSF